MSSTDPHRETPHDNRQGSVSSGVAPVVSTRPALSPDYRVRPFGRCGLLSPNSPVHAGAGASGGGSRSAGS